MVGVVQRMRKLKATWSIRNGIGAALLSEESAPSPVTRIHLTYAKKMYQGHAGARRFWRECLPRLKFYNPSIPITVEKMDKQELPAWLTIYLDKHSQTTEGSAVVTELKDTFAPKPTTFEKTASIDCRYLDAKSIWSQVKRLTGAKDVPMSNEDRIEDVERRVFNAANERMKAHNLRLRQRQAQFKALAQRAREGIN
ncbi:hypothetical protein KEM54_006110 [Ascosphaera aggregata]|nr:hypothetical protein KEM54_006110 [Ascosphaera aggregata]